MTEQQFNEFCGRFSSTGNFKIRLEVIFLIDIFLTKKIRKSFCLKRSYEMVTVVALKILF